MSEKFDLSGIKTLEDLKLARVVMKQEVSKSALEINYAVQNLPKRFLGSTATWIIGSVASGIAAAYMQGEPGTTDRQDAHAEDGEESNTSYKDKLKGVGEEILYFSLGKLVESLLKK